jgi:hypothetical protein
LIHIEAKKQKSEAKTNGEISKMKRKNRSKTKMNRKIAQPRKNLKRTRTGNKQNEAKKSKQSETKPNFC